MRSQPDDDEEDGDEQKQHRPNVELLHCLSPGAFIGRPSALAFEPPAIAPSIAASISAILKGCPETLVSDLASTRNWSRSTVLNCPMFISGTSICLKLLSSRAMLEGIGHKWRTWTCATSSPLARARPTAWWIGPNVEPQPTTASSAPS